MTGLQRLCKIYGRLTAKDDKGNKTEWVWDYARDLAVTKDEMTKEQWAASEKAKWAQFKK